MSFDHQAFADICKKKHSDQAIWWLNGFWNTESGEAGAEGMWDMVHRMIEIEAGRPKLYGSKAWTEPEGSDLDEMQAHIFLEKQGETLTVMALRKTLAALDIDNNKRLCISEYMLSKYKKTPNELIEAPQGDIDPAVLQAAEDAVNGATTALNNAVENKEASEEAVKKAKAAEVASEAAKEEVKRAVADLEAEEKKVNDAVTDATTRANDENAGVVSKNKAKNELAQLTAEDPLPLRKAKITQGAALKKAEKAAKQCAADEAEAQKASALAAQALADAKAAFDEAAESLKIISRGAGVSKGKVWWMNRELSEKKKYMPRTQ